jgi:hypothetical protein
MRPKFTSVSVFLLFVTLPLLGQTTAGVIRIPDATAIRLVVTEPLSSATNEVDDPVRFEVTEDVKVADFVVVPKGSTAVGHVVEVEPKRRLGRAGKLNFSIDHVKAFDGTNVRLRASSTRKGDDRTGTVIVGTVLLSPLFLIMRGKDINIPKGTSMMAYVDGDRDVGLPQISNSAPQPNPPMPAPLEPPQNPPPAKIADLATMVVKSDPDSAEISVDGKFVGNAPSTVQLGAGDHLVSIEKAGFKPWQRSINLTPGGIVTLNAGLEKR